MRKTYLFALLALMVGLALGFTAGVLFMEHRWSQPVQLLRGERGSDADPVPPDDTRGFRPMPFARTRPAVAAFTARDPVYVSIGAVGRDEVGHGSLHLTLRNRGQCEAVALAGVAYGFDAFGRPARMNRGGEHFVAFSSENLALAPGATTREEWPLRHVDTASLVVAQVDRVVCRDQSRWVRR